MRIDSHGEPEEAPSLSAVVIPRRMAHANAGPRRLASVRNETQLAMAHFERGSHGNMESV
jgi:hypothetical protein